MFFSTVVISEKMVLSLRSSPSRLHFLFVDCFANPLLFLVLFLMKTHKGDRWLRRRSTCFAPSFNKTTLGGGKPLMLPPTLFWADVGGKGRGFL